jgi:Protein of unknown function (DUF3892)
VAAQIVAVNKVTSTAGSYSHQHISEVKTAGGKIFKRSEVVKLIDNEEQSFYTLVGSSQASVIVVKCPTCTATDYIRTTADSTTADNLLSLPPF